MESRPLAEGAAEGAVLGQLIELIRLFLGLQPWYQGETVLASAVQANKLLENILSLERIH